MIYIIIGTEIKTGNERVLYETYTDSVNATERCNYLNTLSNEDETYRVETVIPSVYNDATRSYADKLVAAETKDRLNAEFGRNKMDHEEGYPDTDSINETRTKDFTAEELFKGDAVELAISKQPEAYTPVLLCRECGAIVPVNVLNLHTNWHNKLLP